MDFGMIKDPRKQVPFDRREVQSMGIITPKRDKPADADAEADEAMQQRHNKSGVAKITRNRRNPDNPKGSARRNGK